MMSATHQRLGVLVLACLVTGTSGVAAQEFEDDFSDPSAPNWAFYCPAGSCVIENQELHVQANGSSGWGEEPVALYQPSAENYRISFGWQRRSTTSSCACGR